MQKKKVKTFYDKEALSLVQNAIKKIGIGKRKKQQLSLEEIDALYEVFTNLSVENFFSKNSCEQHFPAACGAFFAALFFKEIKKEEVKLVHSFTDLLTYNIVISEVKASNEKNVASKTSGFCEKLLSSVWHFAVQSAKKKTTQLEVLQEALPQFVLDNALDIATKGKTLTYAQANKLGKFLFAKSPISYGVFFAVSDFFCGFFSSYLRVRYETADEWNGLYTALRNCSEISPSHPEILKNSSALVKRDGGGYKERSTINSTNTLKNKLAFVFAEPANGFASTYFLSPLYGAWLCNRGWPVVHVASKNPGPKFVLNLLELLQETKKKFSKITAASGSVSVKKEIPVEKMNFSFLPFSQISGASNKLVSPNRTTADNFFGYVACQEDYCEPIKNWRLRRHATVKRPFFSTLEKFISPLAAENTFLVTSAFHSPYFEKMVRLAQFAGFAGSIVLKSTREGGLTPSLTRELVAKISLRADLFPNFFKSVQTKEIAGEITNVAQFNKDAKQLKYGEGALHLTYASELLTIPVLGKKLIKDEEVLLTSTANINLWQMLLANSCLSKNGELASNWENDLKVHGDDGSMVNAYMRRFFSFVQLLDAACYRLQL